MPWHSKGEYVVFEPNSGCFIFSLDLKEKFIPFNGKELIYCHSNFGPTFGGGYDIYISDRCNETNDSYAYFPSRYNRPGVKQLQRNQETYRQFVGEEEGYNMQIEEYEVFKVIF